ATPHLPIGEDAENRGHELVPRRYWCHQSPPENARDWREAKSSSSAAKARSTRWLLTWSSRVANSCCMWLGGTAIWIRRISVALIFAWLTAALARRRLTAKPWGELR